MGNINLEIDNITEAIKYFSKAKLLTKDENLKIKLTNLINESLK
jgi:hypothetical protein